MGMMMVNRLAAEIRIPCSYKKCLFLIAISKETDIELSSTLKAAVLLYKLL